ncbi:MAG: hypothetical protein IPJ31_08595 [Bacteroidetes bacterium]|nr:hypothetical protein [Bacteroidota bacterium]
MLTISFSNSICQNLHFSPNIIFGYNVDVYKPCALSIDDYGNKYIIGDMQYNFNILNTGFNSNQLHNYYLLKLSANDSLIWLKIIATGDWQTSLPTNFSLSLDMNDMPVIAYTYFDSVASFGNNYYSPGFIDPNTNQYVSIYKNINLCKLDTAGNLLWQKSIIGNFDEDITSKCLDIDNENNIIIIGSFGGGVAFPPYTDTAFCDFGGITLASAVPKMFIVKYNPSGNLIWARNDGGENTSGTSIASDSFSNYYIIGQLPIADAWFDTIHILFPAIYNAVTFIAKYNKNGKAIWVRYFAVDGLADQISNNSILFYNNNILVAGGYACNSNQVVHFENITLANPSGFTNGYITSLDTFGNLLWVKNIFNNFAGDVSHSRLAIDSSNIYFTSSFKGTVCIKSDTLHSNGIWDLLISKWIVLAMQ